MDYQYNTLHTALEQGVLTLTLNRPEEMNSFTVEMANELIDFFTRVNDDDEVGAVIVTGSGRAFCAGMDLTREGNVFGLDESLQPSLQELQQCGEDPMIKHGVRDTGGRVVLSIYDCKNQSLRQSMARPLGSG